MTSALRKILIVDDEAEIRNMLNIFLSVEEFEILEADCGRNALRVAVSSKPDLIVLDLGLGDMDGVEVITALRQFSNVPIVVLTARHDDRQTVVALNAGADDYVTKPFRAEVLLARINANLRESNTVKDRPAMIENGPIRIDPARHEVFVNGQRVAFTPKEFALLQVFLQNKGRMLTHKYILKEVWGPAHTDDTQYLRVYIGQLREKLEIMPDLGKSIVSESGIGYRMDVLADTAAVAAQ
jgi:two-component system KDP operon response regulator KdpE